jgi:type III secretion protein L
MMVLNSDSFQVLPDQKILKAADYACFVNATELVGRAKQEGDRILEQAKEVFESEKQRGLELGLNEGKERVAEIMLNTVGEAVNYFSSLETKMVQVVTHAMERIVGEMDQDELIVRIVRHALEVARNQKQVTLRITPSQVQAVQARVDELLVAFPSIRYIDLQGDARLKEGGCILETDMGIVEASIDVQLEAIRKSLLKTTESAA